VKVLTARLPLVSRRKSISTSKVVSACSRMLVEMKGRASGSWVRRSRAALRLFHARVIMVTGW
jgi:hypothetical protein